MDDTVARILMLVKATGMDQKTFAHKLGVRPQAITEWKQGVTQSYSSRLQQIAELLGTTADYLLTGEKKEPPSIEGNSNNPQAQQLWKLLAEIESKSGSKKGYIIGFEGDGGILEIEKEDYDDIKTFLEVRNAKRFHPKLKE